MMGSQIYESMVSERNRGKMFLKKTTGISKERRMWELRRTTQVPEMVITI